MLGFPIRGRRLARARIALVVLPAFLLFGYNQSQTGGILSFSSFTTTFTGLDTVNTSGEQKVHNATVQGGTHRSPGLIIH